jgi:hypothetical protein
MLGRAMRICAICPRVSPFPGTNHSLSKIVLVKNCFVSAISFASAISYGLVGREGPGAEDIKYGLFRRMRYLHWKAGTRRLYMGTPNHPPKAADAQEV